MEVLRASSRGTPASASGVFYGASASGIEESSSSSNRGGAVAASRPRRGGEDERAHTSSVPCLGVKKTAAPRVLSHLLQFDSQRQHPTFPNTASAAAAVLLAFAAAPIRASAVPAAGQSVPSSAAVSPSPPASPAGETRSSRPAAVPSRSASPASSAADASAAAARFAAAAAAALASEGAIEPGLRRPFTIEEETQQQLLEEEEEDSVAAVAAPSLAESTATAAAALRAEEEVCARMAYHTLTAQRGEDGAHQEDGQAAAGVSATTAAGHAEAAVCGEGARGGRLSGATGGGGEAAKAAATGDGEAAAEEASISTEFVESCVVPWKPTCLTEISFDYSVPSTRGGGAAASPSPYEWQRSITSEPAENSPADLAAGALTTAAANSFGTSLCNRWPSGSLDPLQGGAAAGRGAAAARALQRRQASITSDSDCTAAAAATEGMPSNVSRWRLGRATSLRQQKQHVEQQEMSLQQQQVSGLRLQQQQNSGTDGHQLPLQQQLEAALRQQQEEEKEQNVLQQQEEQDVVQRLLEEHLKNQLQLQVEQAGMHEQQPFETHALLPTELTRDLLLQQCKQQRNVEEVPQQQQLGQPEQNQQQQPQTQELVQHEHFQEAEHFFNLVVQQLQQQQQEGTQQEVLVSAEQQNLEQLNPEQHNLEQERLQQHHSGETGIFLQTHLDPLHVRQQCEEGVGLQQQRQPPGCADLRYEEALLPARTPAAAVLAAPATTEARPVVTAPVGPLTAATAPAIVSPGEATGAFPADFAAGDIIAAAAAAAAATAATATAATATAATATAATATAATATAATATAATATATGATTTATTATAATVTAATATAATATAATGTAATATAAATEGGARKAGTATCRPRHTQPRTRRRKRKNSKGGRFVQTSSSGYPGVSWNRRMGAWLAFFYDTQSRRSRTFHPRYFNGDIEATRIAAIEFKKSVDRLFSSAPKPGKPASTASVQPQHQQDEAQEEQPQEEEQQEEQPPERGEQEENPQRYRLLNVDVERPPQHVSEWGASLLPPQDVKSQPVPEQQQDEGQRKRSGAGREESSSSSRLHAVSQMSTGEGHNNASEAVTVGRKRGREDDVGETGLGATLGCVASPCFTLPRSASVTDLASALLPPTLASNELVALGRDAHASSSNAAGAAEELGAAAVAAIAGAARTHEDVANTAPVTDPASGGTERGTSAAAPPLQISPGGAPASGAGVSSPLGVDLSLLATTGSLERLQNVLSLGTDLPGTSARRLAFSWSRLSTLSADNLNVFCRRSRSNSQLPAQGAGAACPTAGGAAGGAAEDAAREGCKATTTPTTHQLLRQVPGEDHEKEDEQSLSMPSLLQQLQLNEGDATAGINSSEMPIDDAALLREGQEELHRILEQSYGLLPFSFLWRGDLHSPGSKEAYPEATTRSQLEANSTISQKEPPFACSSSSCAADSISDSASRSSNASSSKNTCSSGDGTKSTDGTSQSSSGTSTNDNSNKRGPESSAAISSLKSGAIQTETLEQDVPCNSLEKVCRLLGK